MERETGFEPATSTLARSHSTTELFPLAEPLKYHDRLDQGYGGVRLEPDPTGRRTELRDAAPYRRWRAALSRCASVVWTRSSPPGSNIPVDGLCDGLFVRFAPCQRWRAALSCCASLVWAARRLPAQIFPYTDCAAAISHVSRHTG